MFDDILLWIDNRLPIADDGEIPLMFAKPPIGGVTDVPIGSCGAEVSGSHNSDGFLCRDPWWSSHTFLN